MQEYFASLRVKCIFWVWVQSVFNIVCWEQSLSHILYVLEQRVPNILWVSEPKLYSIFCEVESKSVSTKSTTGERWFFFGRKFRQTNIWVKNSFKKIPKESKIKRNTRNAIVINKQKNTAVISKFYFNSYFKAYRVFHSIKLLTVVVRVARCQM